MSRACIALIQAALVSGCTAWESKMDAAMAGWVGESGDAVIAAWGHPDRTESAGDHVIYIWNRSSRMILPGQNVTTSTAVNGIFESSRYTTPSETINVSCLRTIAVDHANRVVRWGWRGDCSGYVKASVNARSEGIP
jgi:hypothetical protein